MCAVVVAGSVMCVLLYFCLCTRGCVAMGHVHIPAYVFCHMCCPKLILGLGKAGVLGVITAAQTLPDNSHFLIMFID